ncbi:hypothetical protein HN777_02655 [Candidatus Woesearchaeota archaeon]|jgi:hypothetical protein|nr:hypothetical protein [Candidatus Woesearchaeota archaeon]
MKSEYLFLILGIWLGIGINDLALYHLERWTDNIPLFQIILFIIPSVLALAYLNNKKIK